MNVEKVKSIINCYIPEVQRSSVINLLEQQQAEIERLKALVSNGESAIDTNKRLCNVIEQLRNDLIDSEMNLEIMTNYDRIKAMSVEEMAEFIDKIGNCPCCCCDSPICIGDSGKKCKSEIKKHLKSEVTE